MILARTMDGLEAARVRDHDAPGLVAQVTDLRNLGDLHNRLRILLGQPHLR